MPARENAWLFPPFCLNLYSISLLGEMDRPRSFLRVLRTERRLLGLFYLQDFWSDRSICR